MKKYLILLLFFNFLSLNTLYSQSWYVGGVTQINKIYLPNGNINIPNANLRASWSYEYGLQSAFFIDPWSYYANGMYGVRFGILKNESTYSILKDSLGEGELISNKIKSIKVPVAFNHKNETSGWTYELGLLYAYDYNKEINESFNMNPNKHHLSLLAALGFEWELSESGMGLRPFTFCWGIRGSYDILNYTKNNGYENYESTRFLNIGLFVGLNYKIDYYHDHNRYKNKVSY